MGVEPKESVKGDIEGASISGTNVKDEFVGKADKIAVLLAAGKFDELDNLIASESYTIKAYLEHSQKFAGSCKNILKTAVESKKDYKAQIISGYIYSFLTRDDANAIIKEVGSEVLEQALRSKKYDKAARICDFVYPFFSQSNESETLVQEVVSKVIYGALRDVDLGKADDLLSFWTDFLNRIDEFNCDSKRERDEVKTTLARVGEEVIAEKIKWGAVSDVPYIIGYLARNGVIDLKPMITSEKMVEACSDGIVIAASYDRVEDHNTIRSIIKFMINFGMGGQVDKVLRDAYRNGIDKNLENGNPGNANNVYKYFQAHYKEIVDEHDMFLIMSKE